MIKRRLWLALITICLSIILSSCAVKDQAVVKYPEKPVTIIVPYTAGGSADLIARSMESVALKYFNHPLIVTNMPGASATIGWNELAGAKPDGYTIGYTTTSLILQPLYGQTRYHYSTAIEPLAQIMSLPGLIVVRADSPFQNLGELINYAKEHPGELKFGHPGLGTTTHIVGEIFAKGAGVDIVQVPFRGDSEALTALLGDHIQLLFTHPPAIREQVRGNRVRVLSVSTDHRLKDSTFSEIPTFKEQGVNVLFSSWQGIGAPKMLPPEIKARLSLLLKQIINDPEFKGKIENMGMTVEYLGPEDCVKKWVEENDRYYRIIKENGIAELIAKQKN